MWGIGPPIYLKNRTHLPFSFSFSFFFFFLTNIPTYNLQLENGKCQQNVSQQWYVKCTNNSSLFLSLKLVFQTRQAIAN